MLTLERTPIVFGWDPTPGLLAFDLLPDGRSVRVWRRHDQATLAGIEAFTPFLLLADEALVAGSPGLLGLERLHGRGDLRGLARYASWGDALAARERCRLLSGLGPGAPDAPYRFLADPVHQYLLASGRTSFGDLGFGDLRRLALDIEVVTTDGFEFPNAARADDRVVAVALADSTGFRHVVRGDRLAEPDLLQELTRIVRERDPDVIEGHNVFRFDLEYLDARARRHGVALAWGRDGGGLRSRPARLQIAERTIGYRRYEVTGRHVVDTWILAQLHDVGSRDLPSLGLKEIARHLGLATPDRTYVDGASVSQEFRQAPERLMAYALDDAVETLALGGVFAPPFFAQAQILPFDYQSATLRGAAAKIDALMLREYLRQRRAVPRPRPIGPVGGAHVAVYRQGVARPVLHVDVTSLYPSLMLARRIAPEADDLGAFLDLLRHLTDFRVRAKARAREATDPAERAHGLAMQQSFKLLINAFYGYLAFTGGHWNDFAAADRVTAEGRAVLGAIVERLESQGATALEADTDGVYFVPPPGHAPSGEAALLDGIATGLPEGIHLELDGRYAAMFSYKPKTYALLDARGSLTLRGSAFRSRGLEPFQRQIIGELVRLLLTDRAAEARAVVRGWMESFALRRLRPRMFARTETLQDTLEVYREKVRAGQRHVSAAYELAAAGGRPWQPGDQVSYYVSGRGAGVTVNERARLVSSWDPAHPDENVEYYQARVQEIWDRFRPFADDPGLRPVDESRGPAGGVQLELFGSSGGMISTC